MITFVYNHLCTDHDRQYSWFVSYKDQSTSRVVSSIAGAISTRQSYKPLVGRRSY